MSTTALQTTTAAPAHGDQLEATLIALTKYGRPRVSLLGDGWYACVELHSRAQGFEATAKSDFDHRTPTAATSQLLKRLQDQFGAKTP